MQKMLQSQNEIRTRKQKAAIVIEYLTNIIILVHEMRLFFHATLNLKKRIQETNLQHAFKNGQRFKSVYIKKNEGWAIKA